jgi:MoxR-like ATPase
MVHLIAVSSPERILALQNERKNVIVSAPVREYITDLVGATRKHPKIRYGASPRGSLGLTRSAQALALVRGREFALPDDVKELAVPVLTHRIILRQEERAKGLRAEDIIEELIATLPLPSPV